MFDNKFVKEGIIGDENSAGMVTSLHLMRVSALQHTHTALLHLSPLPTIHSGHIQTSSINISLYRDPPPCLALPAHSVRSVSGQYASDWKAFLYLPMITKRQIEKFI